MRALPVVLAVCSAGLTQMASAQFFPMGFLPNNAPFPNGGAYAVTKDGTEVAGWSYATVKDSQGRDTTIQTGCIWFQNTGLSPLIPSNSPFNHEGGLSGADYISNNGSIIVSGQLIWNLGVVTPYGDANTNPSGMAPDGSYIVGEEGQGTVSAFKQKVGGSMTLLPGLSGVPSSQALASSDQGKVIVGLVGTGADVTTYRPVYWDSKGVHQIPMGSGYLYGFASAVNSDGSIIAGIMRGTKTTVGFFYHPGDPGPYRIFGSPQGAGLGILTAIADDGSMACGEYGSGNGDNFGFIWDIDAPALAQDAGGYLSAHGAAPSQTINIVRGCSADGQTFVGDMSPDQTVTPEGWIAKVKLKVGIESVSFAPDNVPENSTTTGVVILNRKSTANELVTITNPDSLVVSMPPALTIPAGEISASFEVTTHTVQSSRIVTADFSLSGGPTVQASLTILVSPLADLVVPSTIVGGAAGTGTITLNTPQGSNVGIGVTSNNKAVLQVPTAVTLPAGKKSVSFPFTTSAVTKAASAQVSASFGGRSITKSVTVMPVSTASLVLATPTLTGGSNDSATVTLTGPAPSTGATVTFKSSVPSLVPLPTSLKISAGKAALRFSFSTGEVAAATSVTLTATYGNFKSAKLTIEPPVLSVLSLKSSSVIGGLADAASAILDGPAPATASIVSLSSSNKAVATVPATAKVASASTMGSFAVNTIPVSATASVTISASFGGITKTRLLTVLLSPISTVTFTASTLVGGSVVQGKVTLVKAAGPSGDVVTLKSSSSLVTVPATVTVLKAETSVGFEVSTKKVSTNTTVTITATLGTSTVKHTLTLTP